MRSDLTPKQRKVADIFVLGGVAAALIATFLYFLGMPIALSMLIIGLSALSIVFGPTLV